MTLEKKGRGNERELERIDRPKLLGDASVTIYMDGLVVLFHSGRRAQAAVHTSAHGHELHLAVLADDGTVLWPTKDSPWDSAHEKVKKIEPFWLFVSSAQHPSEPPANADHSATLHRDGEQNFDRVLDFEGPQMYPDMTLRFKRESLSLINMPHGTFYSAGHAGSELCSVKPSVKPPPPLHRAKLERLVDSSFLTAADITARSTADSAKYLVMLRTNPQAKQFEEVFSIRIGENTHYEMHVFNRPTGPHFNENPAVHFLMYYDLFDLPATERQRFPARAPHYKRHVDLLSPDSPPCDNTQASRTEPMS
jgi:hypothetical protein